MKSILATLALSLSTITLGAQAGTFDFSGTFGSSTDRLYVDFQVDGTSSVLLNSTGYASFGGFDPVLFLFNNTDDLVATDDDSSTLNSSVTKRSFDPRLALTLASGDYLAVLAHSPTDLLFGSPRSGTWLSNGNADFSDGDGQARNSNFFFSLSGDGLINATATLNQGTIAAVPLPAAVWLFGSGLLALAGLRFKTPRTQSTKA